MPPPLTPELLVAAYRRGLFPMAIDRHGTIGWFCPDPRGIIPLDDRFHIPHALRRAMKSVAVEGEPSGPSRWEGEAPAEPSVPGRREGEAPAEPQRFGREIGSAGASPSRARFEVTFDREFERVMRECGRRRREGTWISKEIVTAYCALHQLGHAHSVEVWQPPAAAGRGGARPAVAKLVGGLYGVHIGGAFFGESMFHRVTDASKIALVVLVGRLRARGFRLLDTQWVTPHLARFGAGELARADYLAHLARAVAVDCRF